jgi:predicted CXXCH cytochrome family protein
VNYFAHNYVNRVVAFVNNRLRGQPAAFIANPSKLTRGQDLSTCARCHGPDISRATTEIYRVYEPGYSREGRINDLSQYFKQFPLEPGRTAETVEVWQDGSPKGIGMVFRSFIESACYEKAEVRCYDCHDPHDNKRPTRPGLLSPSAESNGYCLRCHETLRERVAEHTRHRPGTPGAYCYDCHMSRRIVNLASGTSKWTRTHTMSHAPDPRLTLTFGTAGSPNACNECHADRSPAWAADRMAQWEPARAASGALAPRGAALAP